MTQKNKEDSLHLELSVQMVVEDNQMVDEKKLLPMENSRLINANRARMRNGTSEMNTAGHEGSHWQWLVNAVESQVDGKNPQGS